jgi:hypothetical protein
VLRLILLITALTAVLPARGADRAVVLVVSAASPVVGLDSIEVRKLFLGIPVMTAGRALHPVNNFSDERLRQIFLQQVVAMSQWAYDRRILSQVLREGRPRPLELTSPSGLLRTLQADPGAVSFAWRGDVAGNPQIKILRVLWEE